MIILNACHGDASAAIFRDGQLLAAVEEERFTRNKHTAGFPCVVDPLLPGGCRHSDSGDRSHANGWRTCFGRAYGGVRPPHMALGRSRGWRRFGDIAETLAHCLDLPLSSIGAQFHSGSTTLPTQSALSAPHPSRRLHLYQWMG